MRAKVLPFSEAGSVEAIPRILGEKEIQLCAMQGQVFQSAYASGVPIDRFAMLFMSSPMGKLFDGACDNAASIEILRVIAPTPQDTVTAVLLMKQDKTNYTIPDNAESDMADYAYWLGYIYRYLQCSRCVPCGFILEKYSPMFMLKAYLSIAKVNMSTLPANAKEVCQMIDTIE